MRQSNVNQKIQWVGVYHCCNPETPTISSKRALLLAANCSWRKLDPRKRVLHDHDRVGASCMAIWNWSSHPTVVTQSLDPQFSNRKCQFQFSNRKFQFSSRNRKFVQNSIRKFMETLHLFSNHDRSSDLVNFTLMWRNLGTREWLLQSQSGMPKVPYFRRRFQSVFFATLLGISATIPN